MPTELADIPDDCSRTSVGGGGGCCRCVDCVLYWVDVFISLQVGW